VKHFLLMRWNLPSSIHYASLELVTDPRWQVRRRELFERYCLPSVARQTVRDFTWLFFVYPDAMSEADLDWFRAQDERLHVVAVEDPASSGVPEACEAVTRLAAGEDWIITTRLDSDDVLHPEHLRKVRVGYSGERKVVEFAEGFYYDVLRDEIRHVRETQNAFVSLLEPAEGARTAWGWPHHKIGEENEIVYLDEPGWVALVHDHNTTTYLWGDPVSANRKQAVLREFGITPPPYLHSRLRRLEALPGRFSRRARRLAQRLRTSRGGRPPRPGTPHERPSQEQTDSLSGS
jgi:Putative rhamnosyl transferase